MSTADRILNYLNRTNSADFPPSAREIAAAIGTSPSTVSAALRRLEQAGSVVKLGVASDGGRTWALTNMEG